MHFSRRLSLTRHHSFFTLGLLLFAASLLFSAVSASHAQGLDENSEVNMPDPNLREMVLRALRLSGRPVPLGVITQREMEHLTDLIGVGQNIQDLTGLEHATNLTTLYLNNNLITDISPLRGLTQLKSLFLTANAIVDISPLRGLTQLKQLFLSGNAIVDISPLRGLTNLIDLNISYNLITDFSPIDALIPNLVVYSSVQDPVLNNSAGIKDPGLITAIKAALNRSSDHFSNEITIWEMLTLTKLKAELVSDLSGLEYAKNLRDLNLKNPSGNVADTVKISNLSPLSGLTQLTDLDLRHHRITDISALSGLTNLQDLKLNDNQISDISALRGLTQLTTLVLPRNKISDISVLRGLKRLYYLSLAHNQISDISALRGLTRLGNLFLNGNQISDFSPIAGLSIRNKKIGDQRPPPEDDTDSGDRSRRSLSEEPPDSETQQEGSTPEDDTNSRERRKRSLSEEEQDSGANGLPGLEAPAGVSETEKSSGVEKDTGRQATDVDTLDVNRDGKVDSDDVDIVARFVGVPKEELAALAKTEDVHPDVDGDGDVDDDDVREVADLLGASSDERRRDSDQKGKFSQSGSKTQ